MSTDMSYARKQLEKAIEYLDKANQAAWKAQAASYLYVVRGCMSRASDGLDSIEAEIELDAAEKE